MIRSEIENLWVEIHFKENSIPSVIAGKLTKKSAQAIEALITKSNQELLSRVERELPEKWKHYADCGNTDSGNCECPIGDFNQALDQTKATIDRIRGEL